MIAKICLRKQYTKPLPTWHNMQGLVLERARTAQYFSQPSMEMLSDDS